MVHGTVAVGSWKTSFSLLGWQPGLACGHIERALRCELLAQGGIARVGFVLGDQVVSLGTDVSHREHRGFGQFALDREIEVLRVREPVVYVVARIIGKGFVDAKAKCLIRRGARNWRGERKTLADRLPGLCESGTVRSNMTGAGVDQYKPKGASATS